MELQKAKKSEDFEAYAIGICSASICTSLPIDEAVKRMNTEHPTDISSEWVLSEDKTFAGGQPNPTPCENNPETHKHYLLIC